MLRHTNAMGLLHAGVDTTVIALWLGHADVRSTNAYLHADLAIKERALAKVHPASMPNGRYRPPTACWPSSKACDYADRSTTLPALDPRPTDRNPGPAEAIGIVPGSA